ncbi:hypothetical protein [Stakelama marina]|uniref:Uncharacterized protein n=1 Tax=Stakelama marina TaxID=2826939 RepID=A0A8T4IAR5_9SPHN|nr:hypothetical protein [Stakelama marina]MBR0551747.1 hypothetical protein [Stakelama marina]
MADGWKTVGAGMTARRRWNDNEMLPTEAGLRAWAEHWKEMNTPPDGPWKIHRPAFEALKRRRDELLADAPDIATDLNAWNKWRKANLRERVDEAWYLQEIVRRAELVDVHIGNGSAGWAAHEAMHLGSLHAEAQLKFAHEAAWSTGQKQRQILTDTRNAANAKRKAERSSEHARWQAVADEIWQRRPTLSAPSVAEAVVKQLNLSDKVHTVRQRIRKPDTAG